MGFRTKCESRANAAHSTAPAVFITGDHDSVIPPRFQAMVYNAYAGPKRRIFQKNAGHNDPLDAAAQERLQADIDWLWAQAGAPNQMAQQLPPCH